MQNSKFVLLFSTSKVTDVAVIKSLLDANEIPYYITNENYAQTDGIPDMGVMIRQDHIEEAKDLLKDFIYPSGYK